jgi:anti-sigma factor RsiW
MTSVCLYGSSELTLYYYGELSVDDRRAIEEHVASCEACVAALEELELLRSALRPRAEATRTPAEWDGFMERLQLRLAEDAATGHHRESRLRLGGLGVVGDSDGVHQRRAAFASQRRDMARTRAGRVSRGLAVAAALVLAVGSGLMWQRHALGPATDTERVDGAGADAALGAAAARHFERAKLVVLGIAMKDPADSNPADWAYERQLAASLLPETRLFRLSAADRGDARLASLLGDLESVLLQASMATDADAPELQRLQRAIERRDLLVRMDLREL